MASVLKSTRRYPSARMTVKKLSARNFPRQTFWTAANASLICVWSSKKVVLNLGLNRPSNQIWSTLRICSTMTTNASALTTCNNWPCRDKNQRQNTPNDRVIKKILRCRPSKRSTRLLKMVAQLTRLAPSSIDLQWTNSSFCLVLWWRYPTVRGLWDLPLPKFKFNSSTGIR